MSFQTDYLAAQRDTQDEQVRQAVYDDRYLDGSVDAAFGQLPQIADQVYLEGYIAKLKQLPKDRNGRIQYGSAAFRSGGYDDPTPGCWCDEF